MNQLERRPYLQRERGMRMADGGGTEDAEREKERKKKEMDGRCREEGDENETRIRNEIRELRGGEEVFEIYLHIKPLKHRKRKIHNFTLRKKGEKRRTR